MIVKLINITKTSQIINRSLYIVICLLLLSCEDYDTCIQSPKFSSIMEQSIEKYYLIQNDETNYNKFSLYKTKDDALNNRSQTTLKYNKNDQINIYGTVETCQGFPAPISSKSASNCDVLLDYNGDGFTPQDKNEKDPNAKGCVRGLDYESWRDTVRLNIFNENVDWNGDGYTSNIIPLISNQEKIFNNDYNAWIKHTENKYEKITKFAFDSNYDYNNNGNVDSKSIELDSYNEARVFLRKEDNLIIWNKLKTHWDNMNDYRKSPTLRHRSKVDSLYIAMDLNNKFFNDAPGFEKFEYKDYDTINLKKFELDKSRGTGYYVKYNNDFSQINSVYYFDKSLNKYIRIKYSYEHVKNLDVIEFNKLNKNNVSVESIERWFEINNNSSTLPSGSLMKTFKRVATVDKSVILPPGEVLNIAIDGNSSNNNYELWMLAEFDDYTGAKEYYKSGKSKYKVYVDLSEINNNDKISSVDFDQKYIKYLGPEGLLYDKSQNSMTEHKLIVDYDKVSVNNKYTKILSVQTSYHRLLKNEEKSETDLTRFAKVSFLYRNKITNDMYKLRTGRGHTIYAKIDKCKSSSNKNYIFYSNGNGSQSLPLVINDEGKIKGANSNLSSVTFKIMNQFIPGYHSSEQQAYESSQSFGNERKLYEVVVTKQNTLPKSNVSSLFNDFMDITKKVLYGKDGTSLISSGGLVEQFYNNLINGPWGKAVNYILVLYIVFLGIYYLLGMSSMSKYEIIVVSFKIIFIVTAFNSSAGFAFLSSYFLEIFAVSIPDLINSMTLSVSEFDAEKSKELNNPFLFLDAIIDPFFKENIWKQIFANLASGPIGILYVAVILIVVIKIFFAGFRILLVYTFAILSLCVLFCLSPIFLPCLLFRITRPFFDKWWESMLSFSLQPLFMMTVTVIMSNLILIFLAMLLSYDICWGCVLNIGIPFNEMDPDIPNFKLCILYWYMPWGWTLDTNTLQLPSALFILIGLKILVDSFEKLLGWSLTMAQAVAGSFSTGLGRVASSAYGDIGYGKYNLQGIQNLSEKGVKTLAKGSARIMSAPLIAQGVAAKVVVTSAPKAVKSVSMSAFTATKDIKKAGGLKNYLAKRKENSEKFSLGKVAKNATGSLITSYGTSFANSVFGSFGGEGVGDQINEYRKRLKANKKKAKEDQKENKLSAGIGENQPDDETTNNEEDNVSQNKQEEQATRFQRFKDSGAELLNNLSQGASEVSKSHGANLLNSLSKGTNNSFNKSRSKNNTAFGIEDGDQSFKEKMLNKNLSDRK